MLRLGEVHLLHRLAHSDLVERAAGARTAAAEPQIFSRHARPVRFD